MVIDATGFREYDARWRFPEQFDLDGARQLGVALGAFFFTKHAQPRVVCGHDLRSYARDVQTALIDGLVTSGVQVIDIGMCLSPMAYFAQVHLAANCVAMVTASHNPNGWTGVKMGYETPFTLGPDDMAALRDMTLSANCTPRPGGHVTTADIATAYLAAVTTGPRIARPLKVVCATGNGTAGAFLPTILTACGAEVIPLHTDLDWTFPNYNPNPEAHAMLADMANAVRDTHADLALGFDGDGDRCGVIDNQGR
ncbi:MAG: phosphomannomutase/phosphoglucomutase, partial [Deltaproteobacteria bacterium]